REGLEWIDGDVRDAALIDSLVRRSSSVAHLAAVVGVDEYLEHPEAVIEVNFGGSRNVAHACLEHGKGLFFSSTSEVYGKAGGILREESSSSYGPPSTPRWSYAVSKSLTEHLLFALGRRGLRFVTARYFNVYGAEGDLAGRGRVLRKFLDRIRAGLPLQLVDGGEAVRSFCHVQDAVEGTYRLLSSVDTGGAAQGRAFNIGRAEPVTIRRMAEVMIHLSGHRPGTTIVSGPELFGEGFEEIPHRVPDTSAMREATGFEAKLDLESGLRLTLADAGLLSPEAKSPPAPRIPMVRPRFEADPALLAELGHCLESGQVTNGGPRLQRFESELARRLGHEEVLVLSSGAAALEIAVQTLGIRGKAILPSFTYMATLNALLAHGIEPVFCDLCPDDWTLDPAELSRLLEAHPDVGAIVPVNVFGVPPRLEAIAALARPRGLPILYDDAHGFGTELRSSGREAAVDAHILSFHATKVLPAVEGGMLALRDASKRGEARRLAFHGIAADPLDSRGGQNAKMDELRAAVGLRSLEHVDEAIGRRRRYAARLRAFIAAHAADTFEPQAIPEGVLSNFQNFGVRIVAEGLSPQAAIEALALRGVEARRYFYPPLHRLHLFEGGPSLPQTEALCEAQLCLPLHSSMQEQTLARIEAAIEALALERRARGPV
ncbi:MAG: aminotransferase class I/II-fold pyridoxal phosphate-dependent enzyme, partial [Myxococcales bacterium]|nr:aminotransferase class I/II-fold pyridoxal phosphate-dependent enzyme [Myxococcales bacterium]